MSISSKPDFYFDMQQFSEMRLQAKTDQDESVKSVSKQFEGLFMQQILKSMRSAAKIDDNQHSDSMDFYTDMYDKQLSVLLADAGGLGIAKMMTQQLTDKTDSDHSGQVQSGQGLPSYNQTSSTPEGKSLASYQIREYTTAENNSLNLQAVKSYVSQNSAVKVNQVVSTDLPLQVSGMNDQSKNSSVKLQKVSSVPNGENNMGNLHFESINAHPGWSESESFVADVLPHAAKAANKLGISASLLVAQSALETGWGKHAMKRADGSLSFNLFGLKTSHNWNGNTVDLPTLEFRDGKMQQEQAQFRSYESLAEGFEDYVDFIRSNPRYSQALQHQGEDAAYIRGLQHAGYATDPNYADKILSIMSRDEFNQSLAAVSSSRLIVT